MELTEKDFSVVFSDFISLAHSGARREGKIYILVEFKFW
jgi:hypothetical protein